MNLIGIIADPDKWTSDGITAAATASIAIFTIVLVFVTNRQASLTRASVRIAERALTELEAPFILVRITDNGMTKKKHNEGYDFGKLRFTVANQGRTPARLTEIIDKSELAPAGEGPPSPIDFRSGNKLPFGINSPPSGESQPFYRDLLADHKTAVEENPLILRKNDLFFYGFVRYVTVLKKTYRMGFCFAFDPHSERWMLVDDEKQNYLEKEG